MRSTNFEKVGDFQREVLGTVQPDTPALPNDPILELRFLLEEITELNTALMTGDIVGAADAVIDLIYFAYGLGYKMRLPMDELFAVVHEANMTKRRGVTKRGSEDDAMKPDGWQDPKQRIAIILEIKL